MPLTSLHTCSRCKKEYNFNSIKYTKDRSIICVNCLGNQQQLEKKEVKIGKPDEQKKVNFICLNCRFKFSVRKGSPKALKCQFCGKTRLMVVKRYKDEDDLINDSMDSKFDY
ncbi:hypothetical protein CMO83_04985 [Candidatus Woesearchaeota archaeon]|jgi:hypothetical protein|nr:hypothetical protein [Candidatus Woesearchaeota archaeon]|tara:strand:+ start:1161 stop:1496 length:336 start_codon:yes stop_codon:yes gene_type:complete